MVKNDNSNDFPDMQPVIYVSLQEGAEFIITIYIVRHFISSQKLNQICN